jgi:hypothetical protein
VAEQGPRDVLDGQGLGECGREGVEGGHPDLLLPPGRLLLCRIPRRGRIAASAPDCGHQGTSPFARVH